MPGDPHPRFKPKLLWWENPEGPRNPEDSRDLAVSPGPSNGSGVFTSLAITFSLFTFSIFTLLNHSLTFETLPKIMSPSQRHHQTRRRLQQRSFYGGATHYVLGRHSILQGDLAAELTGRWMSWHRACLGIISRCHHIARSLLLAVIYLCSWLLPFCLWIDSSHKMHHDSRCSTHANSMYAT